MALSVEPDHRIHSDKYLAVHPLTCLSIIDHYTRVAKGETIGGKLHATNSFAVPFEEDSKNESLWFLDHNHLEAMADMFAKISRKEKIIGWYSTRDSLKAADLEINELMQNYTPQPIYLLVNVHQLQKNLELPFRAYMAYDHPSSDKLFRRVFAHVNCGVDQFEAEEVAVKHSLKDVESLRASTQTSKILDRIEGLKTLSSRFQQIAEYLKAVQQHKLPLNARILTNIQELFNCCPDLSNEAFIEALEEEITISTFGIYMGSLVRTILALHDLVGNRIALQDAGGDHLRKSYAEILKRLQNDPSLCKS